MLTLTRDQVRSLDRIAVERFAIPGLVLMENAGRGATDALLVRLHPGREDRILVVAGKGNNGGDGFVMARHLANRGYPVRVSLLGHPAEFRGAGEAGTNFAILERLGLPMAPLDLPPDLEGVSIVVDAMLGTGLAGPVRGVAKDAIEALNASGLSIFAVDAPSGLDCDTGLPLGVAIRARATATFAAMKKGFLQPGAQAFTGTVDVVDLGAPVVWE